MTDEANMLEALAASPGPRVWLRAEWGFDPEEGGYLGFTREGNRQRFIREFRAGDLVLIYGADQKETRRDQRRQLLGFLEVEPIQIADVDKSSKVDQRRKIEHGWRDRWTYGVPVKRAWRVNRKIEAQHLARRTFETHNPILIASRCELLTPEEVEATLSLPVTAVNVYGEPPLPPEELSGEVAMRLYFEPSRGVAPSFGSRTFSIEDAENQLYVLKLEGNAAAFLGRPSFEVIRKAIVKVGHAKDPQMRCDAHNAHLPPKCAFRWTVALRSPAFPGGTEAKTAEDELKQKFAVSFEKSWWGVFPW